MQFRPCIDIHNGKVKQIVGSSLKDQGDVAQENFVAEHEADYYAKLYQERSAKTRMDYEIYAKPAEKIVKKYYDFFNK